MAKQISEERKTAYYVGMGLMVVGGLLFASTFVTFAMHFGDFGSFQSDVTSTMFRAFGGVALLVVGGAIRRIGARGLAGSGIVLDPEEARQDLEPYARMAGGMVKDALDEAQIKVGARGPDRVVMIKCQTCGKLNQEDAKFCQECGKKL